MYFQLKLQSCVFLKVNMKFDIGHVDLDLINVQFGITCLQASLDGWLNGCCYLPNIKRILITAERSLTIWDYRNSSKQQNINNQNVRNGLFEKNDKCLKILFVFKCIVTIQHMTNMTCCDSITKRNGNNNGTFRSLSINSSSILKSFYYIQTQIR